MMNEENKSIIKVADVHEQRILQALSVIQPLFPLKAEAVKNLNPEQLFALEMLTSRFAKLQDLVGAKIFDMCLNSMGESYEGLSMIDKANRLEKIGVIDDSHVWIALRKIRNNLAHEYPDAPEATADMLNRVKDQVKPLLQIYHNLKAKIDA